MLGATNWDRCECRRVAANHVDFAAMFWKASIRSINCDRSFYVCLRLRSKPSDASDSSTRVPGSGTVTRP